MELLSAVCLVAGLGGIVPIDLGAYPELEALRGYRLELIGAGVVLLLATVFMRKAGIGSGRAEWTEWMEGPKGLDCRVAPPRLFDRETASRGVRGSALLNARAHFAEAWKNLKGGVHEVAAERFMLSAESSPTMAAQLNAGVALLFCGEPEQAEDAFSALVPMARAERKRSMEAASQSMLAVVQGELGNWRESALAARSAVNAFRGAGDSRGQAMALVIVGDSCLARGMLDEAGDAYRHAERLAGPAGARGAQACVLAGMGELESRRTRHGEAGKLMQKARSIFKGAGLRRGEAEVCKALGLVYRRAHMVDESIASLKEAFELYRKDENEPRQAYALELEGLVLDEAGREADALASLDTALEHYGVMGDEASTARVFQRIGSIRYAMGEHALAHASLEHAREIHSAAGDRLAEAVDLVHIGNVLHSEGRQDEARLRYKRALTLHGAKNNDGETAYSALGSIGNEYYGKGRPDESIAAFRAAAEFCRLTEDPRGEARSLSNMGVIYSELGMSHEAVESLAAARELLVEHMPGSPELASVEESLKKLSTVEG